MRKTALAAALLGALAATPAAAGSNWTGCYGGVLGSYNALVEDGGGDGAEGPGIAGTLGCDLQRGNFVLGALVEYGFTRFDFYGSDIDAEGWAVGGRAGVIVLDNALLYGVVKWTDLDFSEDGYDDYGASGPVVGGGAEIPLGSGLFGRVEYNYAMLDDDDGLGAEVNAHSGRLGLVYKFSVGNDVLPAFESKPLK
jgi:hypothetical protein